MRATHLILAMLIGLFRPDIGFADVGCLPNDAFEQVEVSGEVFGDHDYVADAGFRRLALIRHETGWRIAVKRMDGSVAPIRSAPHGIPSLDSLNISGSDFRNSTNTSSIPGNRVRKFIFGRDALDPALNPGLRVPSPSSDQPDNIITVEPADGEMGIGELIIQDFGLNDLGKGKGARLTYLKFSGCLGWKQGDRSENWRGGADPGVPDHLVLAMRRCGLDSRLYALSDHVTAWGERGSNAALELDMTGDDVSDLVAPVRQIETGHYGLAICMRHDNRLVMAGFDAPTQDIGIFVEQGDFWSAHMAPTRPGGFYPRAAGQGFTLGMTRGPGLYVYLSEDDTVQFRRQDQR